MMIDALVKDLAVADGKFANAMLKLYRSELRFAFFIYDFSPLKT